MKKLYRCIILLLAAVLTLGGPMQILADAQPLYLSDVMVGVGESAEEAKQALTDAGYTVLDHNLNKGAGSAYKTLTFVYLGYKTTADPNAAITDLAVMNMNGGYSFSDYAVLMDKYRDSQVRPFIDRFLATIQEYRDNYNSDVGGNKAKADYACAILNHIREDDSGGLMGDLLLNPTKEERGLTDEQYKNLPDEEKANTVNLTTALMQGNAQVIALMEQTLAMAADANETTWLQRLSALGPAGLENEYARAGVRPADANREMASLYNDTAKKLLESWDELRTGLLDYDRSLAETEPAAAAGDVDVSGLTQLDLGEEGETTLDLLNAEEMLPYYDGVMENSYAIAEEAADHSFDGIYHVLKEMPYGEGTMYDFFTKPYAEVSGENIAALYPMVSTLTAGQIAAIDFLSATVLAQIGATDGEAFEEFSPENSNLIEGLGALDNVSIYYGVNRELFGDKTALTSEVLRDSALVEKAFGLTDPLENLGGLSALTALSWAATGSALLMTAVSAYKSIGLSNGMAALTENTQNLFQRLCDQLDYCEKMETTLAPLENIAIQSDEAANLVNTVRERTQYAVRVIQQDGKNFYKLTTNITWSEQTGKMLNDMKEAGYLDDAYYSDLLTFEDSQLIDASGTGELGDLQMNFKNMDELGDQLSNASNQCALSKSQKFWHGMEIGFGVAFAVLTLVSIGLSAYDLYRYYNVNYTPIPKYIVDEADITTLDSDGNTLVTRNDTAYFTAAPTNRPETHEQYTALQDYADLNGDVGKEWLALYYARNAYGAPILADSFRVVTGSTSIPEGYAGGIHMFGSNAAANLTDSRYTYKDDLNGIYVYYQTEAPATAAASVFSGGALALVGAGSAAAGAAVGAAGAALLRRRRTAPAA